MKIAGDVTFYTADNKLIGRVQGQKEGFANGVITPLR